MEIEENYKGYRKWMHGSKQHIHAKKGETLQDVIQYMRAHLKYFELDEKLTFDEKEIVQNNLEYIVTLRSISIAGRNVIRPGVAAELEAASKQ